MIFYILYVIIAPLSYSVAPKLCKNKQTKDRPNISIKQSRF